MARKISSQTRAQVIALAAQVASRPLGPRTLVLYLFGLLLSMWLTLLVYSPFL